MTLRSEVVTRLVLQALKDPFFCLTASLPCYQVYDDDDLFSSPVRYEQR